MFLADLNKTVVHKQKRVYLELRVLNIEIAICQLANNTIIIIHTCTYIDHQLKQCLKVRINIKSVCVVFF